MYSVFWQSVPVALGNFVAEDSANHTVHVFNRQCGFYFFAILDRRFAQVEQYGDVERFVKSVVLRNLAVATDFRSDFRLVEDLREVEALCLPMLHSFLWLKYIGATDHFIECAETEFCHEFADFLSDELHEVHGMFRIAGEVLAQLRVLRGDANGASVEVAHTHHDAAEGDQWCGGKPELLGTKQCANYHVAPRLHLTIGFNDDARRAVGPHR